jgi:hypothetical protein
MKKIILVIVLLFTAPAMALVTIEVNDLGGGWAALEYSCTGASAVGFGLDVNVTTTANIVDVNILHAGENDGNGVGFGIFPASFDRFIDPNDPNWNDASYTPVADANDPGAAGGLPSSAITIEMGALGLNAPNDGRLIEIQVDASCTMCVSNNSARGGVVLKGGGPGGFAGPPGSCGEISLCGSCPLDITSWEPGIPDGFMGPEDLNYVLSLVKGCAYYYCDVTLLTDAEACLDVTSWEPGIPDGFVGPEDLNYLLSLVKGCAYYYCSCPP